MQNDGIEEPIIYRQSGGTWKKYHEPKFLRNQRRIKEGPRTSVQRRRVKQLGSWQCGDRNKEEFFNSPAAPDDRNYK